jgi:hypothetical protein
MQQISLFTLTVASTCSIPSAIAKNQDCDISLMVMQDPEAERPEGRLVPRDKLQVWQLYLSTFLPAQQQTSLTHSPAAASALHNT